jgi:hypothetical protein
MTAKTSNERGKTMRAKMKADGLREVRSLWVHPEDHPAIRALAAKMTAARKKEPK